MWLSVGRLEDMAISPLEREVVAMFHRLDPQAKQRVRELIMGTTDQQQTPFDFAVWAAKIESIRQEILSGQGEQVRNLNVVDLLREIRDGEDE
jgi:hypothetical protein